MVNTNYYAIKINRFLKHRLVFLTYSSFMLHSLIYKLSESIRGLKAYDNLLKLDYGINIPVNISSDTMSYIRLAFLLLSVLGSVALMNNIYERFLSGIFQREYEVKPYDCKKIEYPYEHDKLQVILGLVHNEEDNKLALKPYYQKIEGNGLFQNILITGTIGTGKTICAIVQIALQLIYLFYNDSKKKCAMLFLDVKGTFYQFVYAFAKECGRWNDLITIELGGKYKYNPLHKPNLTEIELANRIRYILELFSNGGGSEEYWIGKAEATICELIKLIRIYNNGYVNFVELHKMATNEDYRKEKIAEIKTLLEVSEEDGVRTLNEEQKYNFFTALSYFKDEYDRLDEKGQGYIKSEITRMTGPFISTKIVKDTFCPSKEEINFDGFEDVIREGKIVVWKINANKEPKVAKLMAAYLKLDYQKEIMITLEKKNTPEGKILAERLKVTVCDEYQEYCTKNDPDFLAQSREPRSITIAATQSYSSLKKALQNDETMTSVLLQSFVNKIWLRSDDVNYTIKNVIAQISKVEREKVTRSISESTKNSNVNYTLGQVVGGGKNMSSSENIQTVKEEKFDVKFLSHDLSMGQSVCFLSDGNEIISPKVVHLTKLFEGRIICEDDKISFVTDKDKIFRTINEMGTVDINNIENSTITDEPKEVKPYELEKGPLKVKDILPTDQAIEPKKKVKELKFTIEETFDENGGVTKNIIKETKETEFITIEDAKKDELLRDF